MGHAYTPGLRISEATFIEKKRILPLKGEVLVKVGDKVKPDTVVARTFIPGDVEIVNVAGILGLAPEDIDDVILVKEKDIIKKDQNIAIGKGLFGIVKTPVKSPINGTIENISRVTGQVIIRGEEIPVEINAYISGEVIRVFENEGVIIRTPAAFIQGIFGIGGETNGRIIVAVSSPDDILDDDKISQDFKDKIVVGGSIVTAKAVKKAISLGVKGIVVGGFNDKDLREFLGYELGIAITGSEDLGITVIQTEGFGNMPMNQKTFNLLKKMEGKEASISGATQIRAGVIRPEVIIPLTENISMEKFQKLEREALKIGDPIRIIRQPYFGYLATISDLPSALVKLESESYVRVLKARLENGEIITVPRANVELIEE